MNRGASEHGVTGSATAAPQTTRRVVPPVAEAAVLDGFPQFIGRYRRDRWLGRGGMGVVYRYRDSRLDRFVAVKSLPAEFINDPEWRRRFDREARILASLAHPNIAAIYDVAEHEGAEFLLLEYVPGATLADEIAAGAVDLKRALVIALQIARAIEAGHAVNVVHGDIKPANVMITKADVAKLLDYGLAQRHVITVQQPEDSRPAPAAPMNSPHDRALGPIMGTPGYMSTEQINDGHAGRGADIFAFGCVLYECLSGRMAFPGANPDERIAATFRHKPDWDALPPGTPPAIVQMNRACLRKQIDDRLGDIANACAELQRAVEAPHQAAIIRPTPHNLPSQITSFINRHGEMDRLARLLDEARLLTLTGPGGCGKTRLALELARRVLADGLRWTGLSTNPDGVWFIELAPLSSGELVPQAVASAVCAARRLKQGGDQSPAQMLIEVLREQSALLILDNCEHVVEGCRLLARELLRACPNLRMIATSRAGLGVVGEQTYHVPKLSFPASAAPNDALQFESVRLFLERAALARTGFALTRANTGAVAEICRRLEGIPLAIELAAARVRTVPVDEVARRLFEVFDPDHVLESSIACSAETLPPAERTMLGRLCVFRGGWTLEAAETVCGDAPRDTSDSGGTAASSSAPGPAVGRGIRKQPIIDLLSHLVDKSLVLYEERDARARYYLLETVREYSQRLVLKPAKAADEVRRRHMEFYARLAEEADSNFSGPDEAAWLDRLEVEIDNLRAALEFSLVVKSGEDVTASMCRDLHMFWYMRGYAGEGRRWLAQAIQRREQKRDVLQIQLLNAAGSVSGRLGDYTSAKKFCSEALALARERGDDRRCAELLANLGLWAREARDLPASRRFHEEALAYYRHQNDPIGMAMAELPLAIVAKLEGQLNAAETALRRCLEVFERGGDMQRLAVTLRHLSEVRWRLGGRAEGLQLLRSSLETTGKLRDKRLAGSTLLCLAVTLVGQDDYNEAAILLASAAHMAEESGSPWSWSDQADFDACRAALSARLESSILEQLWARGNGLSLDRAIQHVLERGVGGHDSPDAPSARS